MIHLEGYSLIIYVNIHILTKVLVVLEVALPKCLGKHRSLIICKAISSYALQL